MKNMSNMCGVSFVTIKNPDCDIFDSSETINFGTICGYNGSTAQVYAKK